VNSPTLNRTAGAILIAAILVGQTACRSVRRGEPVVGPITSPDPEVQKGRIVFHEHCYKCHPGGEGGLGPSLNDKSLPGFLIKMQVRNGLGVMPSFPKRDIPDDELKALTKYLALLRTPHPPPRGESQSAE
jgi:mono/diheme cytochrome c family protein